MGRGQIALGAVLAVALSVPASAIGQPAPESAVGSGQVAATQFNLSVAGGPFGQDPTGSLELQGFFNFTATPTCMNLAGGAGVVGFRIDNGDMAGDGFLAASEQDPGGRTVQYSAVLTTPPTACPPDDAPAPPDAIENGGGGGVFSGQITDAGGPANPLPLSQEQFSTSSPPSGPRSIARAEDGTLWFIEPGANQLVSVPDDSSGAMSDYQVPTPDAGLSSIAPDTSGCTGSNCTDQGMWFTEASADKIGHIDASGAISEYSLPTPGARPSAIAPDSSGGAWFTEPGADQIGYTTERGHVTEYPLPTAAAEPAAIAADDGTTGPAGDGAWFVEQAARQIGYINSSGKVTEYPLPANSGAPTEIVADTGASNPEGAWFLEPDTNAVGHIDAAGDIDQYEIPTSDAGAVGLANGVGPDGSSDGVWLSEATADQLGFLSSTGQFSEFTVRGAKPGAIAFTPSIGVAQIDGYAASEAVWWADADAADVGFASFPLDTSASAPLVPQAPAPSAARLSLARRVTVRGDRVAVTVSCVGSGNGCQGRVSIAARKTKGKSHSMASKRYAVAAGRHRAFRLVLTRAAKRMLRVHRHGLRVSVDVDSRSGFTTSAAFATLRLG